MKKPGLLGAILLFLSAAAFAADCASTQDLEITVVNIGGFLQTTTDQYSCRVSDGGEWVFGFDAFDNNGRGTLEVQFISDGANYRWQEPLSYAIPTAYSGCKESTCWQYVQTKLYGTLCTNCNPRLNTTYLLGTLTFPSELENAPGPDEITFAKDPAGRQDKDAIHPGVPE